MIETTQEWKIGDCVELMREMPDDSVKLVFADPPYNLGVDYGQCTNDERVDYIEWVGIWLAECKRISDKIIITPGIVNVSKYFGYDWIGCWWKPAAMGHCFLGVNNWEPILVWGKPNKQICDVFRAPIIPDKSLKTTPAQNQSICLFNPSHHSQMRGTPYAIRFWGVAPRWGHVAKQIAMGLDLK